MSSEKDRFGEWSQISFEQDFAEVFRFGFLFGTAPGVFSFHRAVKYAIHYKLVTCRGGAGVVASVVGLTSNMTGSIPGLGPGGFFPTIITVSPHTLTPPGVPDLVSRQEKEYPAPL